MASGDINLNLSVLDKDATLKKRTSEAKELNKELDKATKRPTGTRSGARAAYMAGAADPVGEDIEYNRGRGVAGVTGAGARDFAKQAQGLGGLVRLYATWAANIYAVGAAFTALEGAFAKARVLEAADLLGQRVGISMRSLAKDLQEVSNYALSLEQAVQFANIGTSAGLSGTQQRSLVEIATGAAAATGRDTQDAIRRIIQGTAKQEQEILDELGIFIKARDAYEKYAKEFDVKGGAEALSAQQKVAAYAAEVERAGEKWREFAKIEDPFAKFKAKGSEAIFNILDTVNKFLKPVLNFISDSSEAITALAVLIGVKLTQRALPELGTAMRDAFNFSKFANEAELRNKIANYNKVFEETTDKINALKARRDKLLAESQQTPTDARLAFTQQFGQQLGGRAGSEQRITTGIFGTERTPVDLTKYKAAADIEKAIATSLKEQVASAANKEARLQKIVSLGLAENTSTVENIVLTQKARDIAAETLLIVEKTASVKAQVAAIDAKIGPLIQAQEQAINTLASTDRASQAYIKSVTSANAATGLFARTLASTRVVLNSFQAGLGLASAASTILSANLSGGVIASFLNLKTLAGELIKLVTSAGVGLRGMAAAASYAGAAMGVLSAVMRGLLSFVLGPLMLIITLWELFGDKILRAIGITNEYDDALKKISETEKSRLDGLTKYISALDTLNKQQSKAGLNAKEEEDLASRRFQISVNRRTELEKELEAINAQADALERLGKAGAKGKVEKGGGITFATAEDESKYWKSLSLDAKDTEKDLKVVYDNLAQLAVSRGKIERGDIKLTKEQRVNALIDIGRASTALELQIVKSAEARAGAEIANIERVKAALGSTDDLFKKFDKLLNKTDEFEGSKLFKNDTIREFAKNIFNTVNELIKLPGTATAGIKQATEGLLDYAAKAKAAGVDVAEFVSVITALNALTEGLKDTTISQAQRAGIENLIKIYQDKLPKLRESLTEGLAKSRVNVGGAKDTSLVPMPDFSKRIAAIEKAGNKELEILQINNDAQLKLLDIRERGLTLSADTAYDDRLKLIKQSEDEELAILKRNSQRRTAEFNKSLQEADEIRKQNIAKAGGDRKMLEDADKQYKSEIERLTDSQNAFLDTTNKRIAQINTNATLREAENQARLNIRLVEGARAVKELNKTYKEFWAEEALNRQDIKAEEAFNQRIRLETPRVKAVETARFQEEQRFTKLIRDQEKQVEKLNEEFQNTNEITAAATAFDKLAAAEDQLRKLKDAAKPAIEEVGQAADRAFTFDEYANRILDFQKTLDGAVNGMADTFVEWVKTGKSSFKDLANSLIADIARIVLRAQMANIFEGLFGKGWQGIGANFLANLFGMGSFSGISGVTRGSQQDIMLASQTAGMNQAKGGAWDYGVQKFAKGGMFTNQIVESPTLFKFAKGTGLMGEAGPEAIMPLKRDANGNLGVRAGGGGNVEVVVNNYSTAQAETRETTDSRGNRRIEVVVGEMVAGEVARTGSQTQQAFMNTFGTRPALARR